VAVSAANPTQAHRSGIVTEAPSGAFVFVGFFIRKEAVSSRTEAKPEWDLLAG
jgi:hypothetical protein